MTPTPDRPPRSRLHARSGWAGLVLTPVACGIVLVVTSGVLGHRTEGLGPIIALSGAVWAALGLTAFGCTAHGRRLPCALAMLALVLVAIGVPRTDGVWIGPGVALLALGLALNARYLIAGEELEPVDCRSSPRSPPREAISSGDRSSEEATPRR
ncbi:hypothetical protein [Tautonia sociabilis]|uniref:Uncharacterized protein n=1 Tax=Tautonia sociabilis TaxID=2080755 RepID=A0A432MDI3_9BACT|nr:hypothetical protein [Tautonia sociabilis]RUL82793.1 hypothetical protein TsocGM_23120 [Tautonia sociabilis]